MNALDHALTGRSHVPLVTLSHLPLACGKRLEFRPIVVDTFRPPKGPSRLPPPFEPLFSVGKLREDGPLLIGATTLREEVAERCVPTFLTVDAWAACGLSFDATDNVRDFFKMVEHWLRESFFTPDQELWLPEDSSVRLRALYGPVPWGINACLVISLMSESPWVVPRFPLGKVRLDTRWFLYPDEILAPLGRHAAADWAEPNFLDLVDNELGLKLGSAVRSYYHLWRMNDFVVAVTTELAEETTWLECLS